MVCHSPPKEGGASKVSTGGARDRTGASVSTESVMSDLPDRLYAPVEIAHIVGLTQDTIQNQCRTGQIEARKVGRMWRVTKEEVQRYIKEGPRKVEQSDEADRSK